ncbi:carboxypeptidase regulatory-like domain-containing protein, partial [bacterium]|nr:carboxypeptidase regulatory-like domain-containing protein [bacterium]
MCIIQSRRVQAFLLATLLSALLPWGSAALAEPFHTVTIDGLIPADGTDWAPADRIVNDFDDDGPQLNGNVRHLWLTWDAQNLYLGLNYQALDRTLVVYLDTGRGVGPNDATVFSEFPRRLLLPQGRHADLMLAQYHSGFTNLGTLQAWRANDATGALTEITAQTTNAQTFGVDGTFPGAGVFWFRNEIAIPWSQVYPDGPPARAVLRAVAAVTAAADSSGADDAMPGSGRLETITTPIQLTQMRASIVDQDGDGVPDPLDAGISGTVTLPEDPGTLAVTVTATLTDWSGAELGGPVITAVTDAGVRDYRAGRLAAGTYLVRASAPGYFPAETTIEVSAGQELADIDFTLQKATTITGTLALELGQYRGGYRFRDPTGAVFEEKALLPRHFPYHFTFYVIEGGTYTLEAWAANHLTTSFALEVTAGEDLLDQELILPRAPLLSGLVTFNTGPGIDGVVTLGNAAGDTIFTTADFTASSGSFSFYAPRLGDLLLTASAQTYLDTELAITAEAGVDQTELALPLARQPEIDGVIAFVDGPGSAGFVYVTGPGEDTPADTLAFDATGGVFGPFGDYVPFYMPEGVYDVAVDAPGYGLWTETVTLVGGDTVTDLGEIALAAIRADRLRLLDADGLPTESVSATVSIPVDDFYSYVTLTIEAVGDDDRRDLFDLDEKLTGLPLTARKMDDVAPPRGFARFLASEDIDDLIAAVDILAGVTTFYMANDAVEVLRVFVGPDVPDPLKQGPEPPTARVMVGFNDPRPATVVLSAARDTLAADGEDALTIRAELYDSAGNPSELPEIPVIFTTTPASSGRGAFTVPTVESNPDGVAEAELTATGTGELLIDCAVIVDNQTLEVRLATVDGEPGPLPITVVPGPTAAWRLSLSTQLSGLHTPVTVTGQLVDRFGNPTPLAGESLPLAAEPPALGTFTNAAPVSDAAGRIRTVFQPAGIAGLVTIGSSTATYPVDGADLQLRDVMVVADPPYDQEPESNNTFPPTDLTALVLDNDPDALLLEIPYATNFGGMILSVAIETGFDAFGGPCDPFTMPVTYGHTDKPDYVLTSKIFWDGDYTDLRRWGPGTNEWEWWNPVGAEYIPTSGTWTGDVMLQDVYVFKDAVKITARIPWAPFGGRPDSLRVEVYLTQEDGGQRRSAFDSVPSDNTLDLDFDYLNPGESDWNAALGPVTLSVWSPTYTVRTDFPTPPTVTNATATPAELEAGSPLTLTARVTDAGDGVGDVLADLSAIAGAPLARMHDDGESGHGDTAAGDGIYSLRTTVPLGSPGGARELIVSAFEATNLLAGRDTVTVRISAQVDVIVHAEDP